MLNIFELTFILSWELFKEKVFKYFQFVSCALKLTSCMYFS